MHQTITRFSTISLIFLVAFVGTISLLSHFGQAAALPSATFTVSNTNDSGAGSLRQAILDANSSVGEDVIEVTAVGTVALLSPLPTITDTVKVEGSGVDLFIVDGQGLHRVFDIGLTAVTLADLTIQQGSAADADGRGGGIRSTGIGLTLDSVNILSSTAESHGGGVYVTGGLIVSDSLFQNNHSISGTGGAILSGGVTFMTDTQFVDNTSRLSGGGLYALGELHATNGLFQGNQSLSNGGGLFSFSQTTLQNTQFLSNTAQNQGGGASAPGVLTITNGLFQNNQTIVGTGGGLFGQDFATLQNTHFLSNTAQSRGGGIYMLGAVTLTNSLIQDNQSLNQGGGLYVFGAVTVDSTQFLGNVAIEGGGLYHGFDKDGRLTNTLFANNKATNEAGAAMLLASSANVEVVHVTIGGQSLASGAAVAVLSGTVGITNTIIVSHAIGISLTSGTVSQDYNLFFDNGVDSQGGVSGGANSLSGNPSFQNPVQDNYHLDVDSAAIDGGTDSGVLSDFEGEIRPFNAGFDIGFDEINLADFLLNRLYLPLVNR
ncbi:hypothetical protein [Candidatus Leptofilum sp.]|uniref:hypothetical protein n=1 Tax=Candidatus Leptofilum sp. TaxID=3241576 RepID=UPI003B5BC821